MEKLEAPLSAAEEIAVVMEEMGLTPVIIGAVALAAYHYRDTIVLT